MRRGCWVGVVGQMGQHSRYAAVHKRASPQQHSQPQPRRRNHAPAGRGRGGVAGGGGVVGRGLGHRCRALESSGGSLSCRRLHLHWLGCLPLRLHCRRGLAGGGALLCCSRLCACTVAATLQQLGLGHDQHVAVAHCRHICLLDGHQGIALQLGAKRLGHLGGEHAGDVLLAVGQLALDLAIVQALQVARHLRAGGQAGSRGAAAGREAGEGSAGGRGAADGGRWRLSGHCGHTGCRCCSPPLLALLLHDAEWTARPGARPHLKGDGLAKRARRFQTCQTAGLHRAPSDTR